MRAAPRFPSPKNSRWPSRSRSADLNRPWVRPALLLLLVCQAFQPALGQGAGASFRERILSLINRPQHRSAFWGLQIVRLDSREILFAHNAGKRFQPASGYEAAGCGRGPGPVGPGPPLPGLRSFWRDALDSQGRVIGNLVLAGRGDPNPERRLYRPGRGRSRPSRVRPPSLKGSPINWRNGAFAGSRETSWPTPPSS